MIRMGSSKACAGTMVIAAALLASLAAPCRAAEQATWQSRARSIDLDACAKPAYPAADLRAEHTGTVTVYFLIAADGTVKEAKIVESSGYQSLDEAARSALSACRFTPAGTVTDAAVWLPVRYRWFIDGVKETPIPAVSLRTQEQAFLWAARILARYRYKPVMQSGAESPPVLDRYLKALDPERALFTQSDIAGFESQRERLARSDEGNQVRDALAIFEQMRTRKIAMLAWTAAAMRGPLSALDGAARVSAEVGAGWPGTDEQREALWQRSLAHQVQSLRDAGASDKQIVAIVARRIDRQLATINAQGTRDGFEVFMNAYVGAFDPHGVYLPPLARRAPSGMEESPASGVGLIVHKRDEWVTVKDMIGAGAAWRSGQLAPGDRIVGVAQGVDQPMIAVVGWDTRDVVALLRGVPGSTVVLSVSPGGARVAGTPRTVVLVRDALSGPEHFAHATAKLEAIQRGRGNYRVGVITIPVLYEDAAAKRAGIPGYASTTREVAELLAMLKAERADAVLLDMRRNGGGWLTQATGLAGLFLPHAPVAQQRESDAKIKMESAPDGAPAWDGPLAVLIDEGSAAGTEIVTAALQDHGRGLVLGDHSAGRGSVQTLLSLDRFAPNRSEQYGELKMTVSQVFRVSGASFEQVGVTPDIDLPGMKDLSGQAHQAGFPTAPISPVAFVARGEVTAAIPELLRRRKARMAAQLPRGGMPRAPGQPSGKDKTVLPDIAHAQLEEALQVVGDQIELLRTTAPK